MTGRVYPPVEVRFWAKVDKRPGLGPNGDCWLWTGHVDTGGYGTIRTDGKPKSTHRLSYELAFGPIPAGDGHHGVCVCHRCDNRVCVNPAHLFLGDHAVNMADAAAKRRFPVKRGQRSHLAKLTDDDVRAIRDDRRLLTEIADDYGVSTTTISGVRRQMLWTHVV